MRSLDVATARRLLADLRPDRMERVLLAVCEAQPPAYGPARDPAGSGQGLRALSLLAELMSGDPPSCETPCPIRWGHGGKERDALPRGSGRPPDGTIESLRRASRRRRPADGEGRSLRRLARLGGAGRPGRRRWRRAYSPPF
jgi:hypothetical protein